MTCQPTNGCFSHLHSSRVSHASSPSVLLLLHVRLLRALRRISLPLGLQLVRLCPRRLQHLCLRARVVLMARQSSHAEERIRKASLTAAPLQRGRGGQTHGAIPARAPPRWKVFSNLLVGPRVVSQRGFALLHFVCLFHGLLLFQ